MKPTETAPKRLRKLVNLLNNMREDFSERFTVEQLVVLHLAYRASGWDITPDVWTTTQVGQALRGFYPAWDEVTEKPVHTNARERSFDRTTGAKVVTP